jgi:hypothetical protein
LAWLTAITANATRKMYLLIIFNIKPDSYALLLNLPTVDPCFGASASLLADGCAGKSVGADGRPYASADFPSADLQ